jgi:acetylornithine deacetylase/succinyl-diaminopimelate desuccinylase-like protein
VGDNKEETYFFYGHYDKQPPMEGVSGWTVGGPYNPTPIVDEQTGKVIKLYGRGGADDGYSTYATMVAIKALQLQRISLPRIVMIAEGDEETGNGDVEYWIERFLPRFGTPKMVFCLDSGTLDYDRFWLTNSLRGYLVMQFSVQVLTEAVHSGSGTGVIPTCFRIIRQLLDRIELASTGEMPKLDLPEGIPENRVREVEELVEELG